VIETRDIAIPKSLDSGIIPIFIIFIIEALLIGFVGVRRSPGVWHRFFTNLPGARTPRTPPSDQGWSSLASITVSQSASRRPIPPIPLHQW
jgi:hypothetical protein